MNIIGFSAFYHDSAACLIKNSEIVCAVQEERFSRIKHDSSFPKFSINFCLKHLDFENIDHIVFYEKPFLKFERIIETCFSFAPRGFNLFKKSMPIWVTDKIFLKNKILKQLTNLNNSIDWENKLLFSDHHLSHQASAFYPSPFDESAILTMDGVGEWASTSVAIGSSNLINQLKQINFPNSLGLLYSAFTYYLGFKVNSGEYKVMGLAPYGEPKYADKIFNNLIILKEDGSFKINMDYFSYCTDLKMINKKFENLFGISKRKAENQITQDNMDIASSIQKVTDEIVLKICKNISKETGQKNLCLAGGVALNCVSNSKIIKSNLFNNVWIQPASGDAGGSLGAALAINYLFCKKKRNLKKNFDSMKGSLLGPSFHEEEIEKDLKDMGAVYKKFDQQEIINKTAMYLSKEKAFGWMNGKMEFGPRALGARSIIADPRSPKMQKNLNLKIKFRESFRPFAPSVLDDYAKEWFDLNEPSPYMLLVSEIHESKKIKLVDNKKDLKGLEKLYLNRSKIPAVTHVDYTARLQTVDKDINPIFFNLIKKFYEITNVPILINTSFNVRGEPIVCSARDAFKCFMGTNLDGLVIDNFLLLKEDQNKDLLESYYGKYDLD